ncbi:glycosyltransferase family 4 protein [Aggregatilinea lenta]|uniref:glycosyltransferase family 4 protein n=1 Tax=Aggregatilinea lenta TaxID=913108 RepID=UPI000E5C056B|nr:glycosyltransferase family 4 protein [Aggregatilinea lenta]
MRIGFVATRIAGVDGVSLEILKIAAILRDLGHGSFYLAGELGAFAQPGMEVPAFHFKHPEAVALHDEAFSGPEESRDLYRRIARAAEPLKARLYEFVERYQLDAIITQNAQAIPMQIPLGVALRDFIDETHIPTLAHCHDFYWERDRFIVNRIPDILQTAFPSEGTSTQIMVINTAMQRELYARRKLKATVLPNIFDFETPAPTLDDYSRHVREDLNLAPEDRLILQPTRIIRRKNIERAVELVRLMQDRDALRRYVLVVTGYAGDETDTYYEWLLRQVQINGVEARFIGDRIVEQRAERDGQRLYTLWDVYPHADLISYLSSYEGFGNALLETLYFRKPLVVNAYIPYRSDIKPAGVQAVEIREEVTPDTARAALALLDDPAAVRRMVEHNYQVGLDHFSYHAVMPILQRLLGG